MHGKFAVAVFAFPILGLFIGVFLVLTYILKPKSRTPYILVMAGLGLAIPALIWLGEFLHLPKLTASGFGIPLSLICLITALDLTKRHKNCTEIVSAKCIASQPIHVRHYTAYAPVFSYFYERKLYKNCTFVSYSRKKFEKNFKVGQTYEIHINPKNPDQCIDKRVSSRPSVSFLVVSLIMLAVSVLITITVK